MSARFASHLSPAPVSIKIHFPAARINREFMAIRMRLRLSGGETRSHIGRGITPNIAPPSRRNVPSVRSQNSRSPSFICLLASLQGVKAIHERLRRGPFFVRPLLGRVHPVRLVPPHQPQRAPEIILRPK